MTPTTTDDQRALGLSSGTDPQGRNWVFPGPECGVCGSLGGHLPDCPAEDED